VFHCFGAQATLQQFVKPYLDVIVGDLGPGNSMHSVSVFQHGKAVAQLSCKNQYLLGKLKYREQNFL